MKLKEISYTNNQLL